MIRVVRVIRDRELHALDLAVEVVAHRAVVRRNRRARILTDIRAVIGGEDRRQRRLDVPLAYLLAVGVKRHLATLAETAASIGELHADLVLACRERIVITTSNYSRDAIDFVDRIEGKRVVLINGKQLAQLMIEHDVGVSTIGTYILKEISNDFFEEDLG